MASSTKPIVFLSFDIVHDEPERLRFLEQMDRSAVSFSVDDWTRGELPLSGRNSLVRGRISRSSVMIILVGERTHLSNVVASEIQMSKGANVPFFGVYIGQQEPPCELPPGLPGNRTIAWDWEQISSAIGQLMTEGKHHIFK